jgi:hypothetical protein
MSKHKSPDEKLHSYRSDKKLLQPAVPRAVSRPPGPIKGTGANNQFR